ncbi:MAG TPA: glycoside hydrolase family 3 N-terminal domain-containing protein [Solirubrobacteraceae bacterium]|nr:glycoside hydrolase family 3 N-terminal domain-containing protein [Solirubrobacteraceae bacterium]
MPRRARALPVLAVLVSGLGPAALATARAGGTAASAPPTPALSTLSPEQLAGERVIYSYEGLTPPPALGALIRAGDAAGVIFFQDNISSETQLRRVIAVLQTDALRSPVKLPLLMLTDQEGGEVRRLPGAPAPSEAQIGQSVNAIQAARAAGQAAGLNLRGVGINVNLAPVLDVYRRPVDFIAQQSRGYSRNSQTVARLGAAFIAAQQQTGVAATAKHFPGLGAAPQSTDIAPARLAIPLTRLRASDERPYTAAIAAGVRLVMLSWAVYPALDPTHPAGLSRAVINGELRTRLGFTGVTISDALAAGALRSYGSTGRRATLAAGAGVDLILCASGQVGEGDAAVSALAGALTSGTLSRAGFRRSVQRVVALRRGMRR